MKSYYSIFAQYLRIMPWDQLPLSILRYQSYQSNLEDRTSCCQYHDMPCCVIANTRPKKSYTIVNARQWKRWPVIMHPVEWWCWKQTGKKTWKAPREETGTKEENKRNEKKKGRKEGKRKERVKGYSFLMLVVVNIVGLGIRIYGLRMWSLFGLLRQM